MKHTGTQTSYSMFFIGGGGGGGGEKNCCWLNCSSAAKFMLLLLLLEIECDGVGMLKTVMVGCNSAGVGYSMLFGQATDDVVVKLVVFAVLCGVGSNV